MQPIANAQAKFKPQLPNIMMEMFFWNMFACVESGAQRVQSVRANCREILYLKYERYAGLLLECINFQLVRFCLEFMDKEYLKFLPRTTITNGARNTFNGMYAE